MSVWPWLVSNCTLIECFIVMLSNMINYCMIRNLSAIPIGTYDAYRFIRRLQSKPHQFTTRSFIDIESHDDIPYEFARPGFHSSDILFAYEHCAALMRPHGLDGIKQHVHFIDAKGGNEPPADIPANVMALVNMGGRFVHEAKPLEAEEVTKALKDLLRKVNWRLRFAVHPPKNPQPACPLMVPSERICPINYIAWSSEAMASLNSVISIMTSHLDNGNSIHITSPFTLNCMKSLDKIAKLCVIGPGDKNIGIVIMSKVWYKGEVLRQLSDTTTYTKMDDKMANNEYLNRILQRLTYVAEKIGKIHPKLKEFVLGNVTEALRGYNLADGRTLAQVLTHPEFYGLAKLHKEGKPKTLRPIVPMCKHICHNLNRFVAEALKHEMHGLKHHLFAGAEMANIIESEEENNIIPRDSLVFTADISSLYTNVPVPEAKKMIMEEYLCKLSKYAHWGTDSKKVWAEILALTFDEVWFMFDGKFYKQGHGLAMGCSNSVVASVLFVNKIERRHIPEYERQRLIRLIRRYIDDLFAIWLGTRESLQRFLDTFFLYDFCGGRLKWDPPVIKTAEELLNLDEPLVFLDLELYTALLPSSHPLYNTHVRLLYRPHIKALSAYQYCPYISTHPRDCLRGLVKGELLRRLRLSSTEHDFNVSREHLRAALYARGYPIYFVEKIFQNIKWDMHTAKLRGVQDKFDALRQSTYPFEEGCMPYFTESMAFFMPLRYSAQTEEHKRTIKRGLEDMINHATVAIDAVFPDHKRACTDAAKVTIAIKRNAPLGDKFHKSCKSAAKPDKL